MLGGLINQTISLPVISGSNPNLEEETADSYTVGAVIQPRYIPGLAISVDYYDITVKNVIVSLSAQQIVNNCYHSPSLSNPFCGLFSRWQGPGNGSVRPEVRARSRATRYPGGRELRRPQA